MDKFIEVLFNTNHEMPSGYVLAAIVAISLITSAVSSYIKRKRQFEQDTKSLKDQASVNKKKKS